jgi:hypothetical protein
VSFVTPGEANPYGLCPVPKSSLKGEASDEGVSTMPSQCANHSCSTPRTSSEGTMFRLDIELGDVTGRRTRKSTSIWLCSRCSLAMKPEVEVTEHAVRLKLSARDKEHVGRCSTAVN